MHRPKAFIPLAPPRRPAASASQGSPASVIEFYREEFLKLHQCLEVQREYFSEGAISEIERVLLDVLSSLDQVCCRHDAECVVSELLKRFDVLARLATWSDPRQVH